MKTFTSLLIGCSLALAGAAFAQQPEQSTSPGAKKGGGGKNRAAEARPGGAPTEAGPRGGNAPQTQGAAKQHGPANPAQMPNQRPQRGNAARAEQGAPNQPSPAAPNAGAANAATARKGGHKNQPNAPTTGAAAEHGATAASPAASASPQAQGHGKAVKGGAKPSPSAAAAGAPSATPATAASATSAPTATPPKAATSSSAAAEMRPSVTPNAPTTSPAGATAALPTPKPNTAAATKKPAPQQLQQIKQQHASFHAQPRPQLAPAVTFNPSHRFEQAQQWQGPQYEVFRRYHPERHDEGWYRSHYRRVELIGGGWYYWDNGYWYPAWGYSPSQEYYAYDGPIYVGQRAEPPDQVIADVQTELKDMGYYTGEIDGLVGPLTRQALTQYQADSGLYQTAAIDEPTLDSLGLNS